MARVASDRKSAGFGAGVLVGLGALLGAAPAAACPVELVPADAPAPWVAAAAGAREQVARRASDCGSIELAVRPSGGALLTFFTADGRRAVRALMSPDEVAPALDALLVTLPAEPPDAAPAGATPIAPRVGPTESAMSPRPARDAAADTRGAPPEVHFAVGASAGTRFGFGGVYLTPAFILRPSGTFGAWELAANIELDPAYTYLPGGVPPGFHLWSFIAGVQVGRRETLGSWSIGYGLGLGVAAIREEVDDVGNAKKVTDFGQPRASASGRLGLPAYGRVRPTFDLGVDAALANFKKRATERSDVPELPRWGLVMAVGVEILAL